MDNIEYISITIFYIQCELFSEKNKGGTIQLQFIFNLQLL